MVWDPRRSGPNKRFVVPNPTAPIYLGQVRYCSPYSGCGITSTKYYDPSSDGNVHNDYVIGHWHKGPPYRSGGNVSIWKSGVDAASVVQSSSDWEKAIRHPNYSYNGDFVVAKTFLKPDLVVGEIIQADIPTLDTSFGDPTPHGATAWKRFAPGKSQADLGIFLGEIKDVPRMLKTSAKGFHDLWKSMGGSRTGFGPKKVADHWLNTQFGWLPFISDMRKFYHTFRNIDESIKRIRRENGRWVRRGGTVFSGYDSDVVDGSDTITGHFPTLVSYFYPNGQISGNHTLTRVNGERAWFEAAFRYYIPDIESPEWERKVVRQLFGGTISPSVLWELTPWSWLVDWVSNAGDVFSNMDTGFAQNLTAKFAYVMKTTERRYTLSSVNAF